MARYVTILVGVFLGLGALAITVTLPPRATVDADEIRLGKVAAITEAGDDQERLSQVVLGTSPVPGQSRTLTPEMIRVRLRQFGFNPDAITLDCPPSILITRLTTTVKGDMFVEIAREWLRQRLAPAVEEKLELTPTRTMLDVQLPVGELTWDCAPAGLEVGSLRHMMLTVLVDGKPAWRGVLSFRLSRYAEVLVARAAIPRKVELSELSVAKEWRDITMVTGVPLRNPAEVAGKRAANSLAKGAVLTGANTESVPLVKRNDLVHVRATCGSFVVIAVAVALEDGLAGAVIRVRNPDSHQEYSARIVGAGMLELVL